MPTFKFEALNADGGREHGDVEAESLQDAIESLKEEGLFPTTIKSVSGQVIEKFPAPASSPDSGEAEPCHSYGWKIRLRKLLISYMPLLLVAMLSFYLFFKARPHWLFATVMVPGLFGFVFAGIRIELKMLNSFICPRCRAPIEDWDTDAKYRVIYHCSRCKTKWDIGYKLRPSSPT